MVMEFVTEPRGSAAIMFLTPPTSNKTKGKNKRKGKGKGKAKDKDINLSMLKREARDNNVSLWLGNDSVHPDREREKEAQLWAFHMGRADKFCSGLCWNSLSV